MKKVVLMAIMIATGMCATAQESVETTIGADVVNQYIWRGQNLGNVSLQPTLGVSYKGLSLTAWGSVGLANSADTKEFDLTLSYTLGGLISAMTSVLLHYSGSPTSLATTIRRTVSEPTAVMWKLLSHLNFLPLNGLLQLAPSPPNLFSTAQAALLLPTSH